jgi:hypothetical protein
VLQCTYLGVMDGAGCSGVAAVDADMCAELFGTSSNLVGGQPVPTWIQGCCGHLLPVCEFPVIRCGGWCRVLWSCCSGC